MALTINFVKQLEQRRKEALEGEGDVEEEGTGGIGTKLRRLANSQAGEKLSVGDGLMLMITLGLIGAYFNKDTLVDTYFRRDAISKADSEIAEFEQKISAQSARLASFEGIRGEIDAYEKQEREFLEKIDVIKSVRYGRNSIVRMVDQVMQSLPDDIWMSKVQLDIKGATKGSSGDSSLGELKIDGFSKNFQEISKFLSRLESIYFFKNWKLDQSETDAGAATAPGASKEMIDSKKFSISAQVERAI